MQNLLLARPLQRHFPGKSIVIVLDSSKHLAHTRTLTTTTTITTTIHRPIPAASGRSRVLRSKVSGRLLGAVAAVSAVTMSDKLCPANPSEVMVIRNVTPNVVTFSVPFLRFGRIPIGGRGTLVRLTSGSLAIFSPVALTPEAKEAVSALGGAVKYIVALDREHHLFVSEWKAAYPDAAVIGPEGLPEKRLGQDDARVGPDTFDLVFTKAGKRDVRVGPDFDADFAYEYVDAHPNGELVFCFRRDGGVLIQADYLFNLPAREQYSRVPEAQRPRPGVLARLFLGLNSIEGEAKGIKRLLWYAFSRADRPSWNDSAKRIHAWTFQTIVPCHGDVIEGNGKEVFEKVFEWHLKA